MIIKVPAAELDRCIATLRAVGMSDDMAGKWMGAWGIAWPTAFVVLLFVAPLTRRMVAALVRAEG